MTSGVYGGFELKFDASSPSPFDRVGVVYYEQHIDADKDGSGKLSQASWAGRLTSRTDARHSFRVSAANPRVP